MFRTGTAGVGCRTGTEGGRGSNWPPPLTPGENVVPGRYGRPMIGWFDTCDPQLGAEAYAVLIRSERDAENTAGRWLHRLGYTDAVLTAVGHDNGIDVISAGAVAQVKRWRTKLVGIRDVQRLAGAAEPGQTCLFFASYGYTAAAKAWAERSDQRVALFIMRDNGTLVAVNQWAYLALCDAPIRW